MNCPKCGVTLLSGMTDCPKCFTVIKEKISVIEDNVTPTDVLRYKAIGATLGFGNGILVFFFLTIIAGVIVMFGYHYEYLFAAICSIFLIATMLRGYLLFRQGKCPHCPNVLSGYFRNDTIIKCKTCKHQIRYKDEKFWPIS